MKDVLIMSLVGILAIAAFRMIYRYTDHARIVELERQVSNLEYKMPMTPGYMKVITTNPPKFIWVDENGVETEAGMEAKR